MWPAIRLRTSGDYQRRGHRPLPPFNLQHPDSANEAVLISDVARRLSPDLLRAAPGLLNLDRPPAQCREHGRQIRHHRFVGALVNFHVAHAACHHPMRARTRTGEKPPPNGGHPLPGRRTQPFASNSSAVLPEAKAALNHAGRLPMPPQVVALIVLELHRPRRWLCSALLEPLARRLATARYRHLRGLAGGQRETKVGGRQAVVGDRVVDLDDDLCHFFLAQRVGLRL